MRAAVAAWPRLAMGGLLPAERIGVAVSGGADSVYLLLALWADETLRPRLRVLHFNHRVRGEASEGDARFVQPCARPCPSLASSVSGVQSGSPPKPSCV